MEHAAANGGLLIDQDGNILPPESPTDGEMPSINDDGPGAVAA